jgi:hypothetical protein
MDSIEIGKKDFEEVLRKVFEEVKEIIKSNIKKGVEYPNLSLTTFKINFSY